MPVRWSVDWPDETVSQPGQSLDPMRRLRRIAQNSADPFYRVVQAVIKIDESVGGPEFGVELLAGNYIARPFDQHSQDLKRLARKPKPNTILPQLPGSEVQLERTKAVDGGTLCRFRHYFGELITGARQRWRRSRM